MIDLPIRVGVLFGTGFALGLRHALDADHVAAVATLVTRTKCWRTSSALGLWWGVGHTVALLTVGLLILLLKLSIPPRFTLAFEFGVGVILIGFGFNVLLRQLRHRHRRPTTPTPLGHSSLHAVPGRPVRSNGLKSMATGVVHGLAGSAALTLLVLTTVPSTLLGMLYILIFGLGSILSMLIVSTFLSLPFLMTRRHPASHAIVTVTTGLLSLALGSAMVSSIAFTGRLIP